MAPRKLRLKLPAKKVAKKRAAPSTVNDDLRKSLAAGKRLVDRLADIEERLDAIEMKLGIARSAKSMPPHMAEI